MRSSCTLAGAGARSKERLGVRKAGTVRPGQYGELLRVWGGLGKDLCSQETLEKKQIRVATSLLGVIKID